uniref:Uncharacterized protein n=1 Tax=Rangifer tarandus platyrhynchus TaxID=3082113 RepID=A0ACB0FK34_RANTA|nr:unnamed protein product [Rangifer tarandus platyrhynchus]
MLSRGGGVRRPSGNAELQLPSLRRTLLTAPSLYGLARESKGIGCLWLRWPPWRRRSRGHGAGSGYRRRCSAQPRGGDPSDPVPAFAQAREEPPERGRRELSVPTVGVGSGARDRGGKRTLFHSRTSLLGQTCPRGTSQGARRSFPPVVQNPRSGWAGTAGLCNWGFEVLRPLLEERGGGVFLPCGRGRGGAGRHSRVYSVIIVRPREKRTDYVRAGSHFPVDHPLPPCGGRFLFLLTSHLRNSVQICGPVSPFSFVTCSSDVTDELVRKC